MPAIVVSAYNRPAALRRLLASLLDAVYPAGSGVPLIVSVDRGDSASNAETVAVAEAFAWPFGPKQVIHQARPLGLVEHVFFCWSLAETHDAIIFLEDDFIVSPAFYAYAAQALAFYHADERVGALSLYALWFNGYTHEPFVPLPDESDVFFMQVPFFQGLAFTREQWRRFDDWRKQGEARPRPGDPLHDFFLRFPEDDYYPILAKYIATRQRFVVYPRVALCLGLGEVGTHFRRATDSFQTPLQRFQTEFRFKRLADSLAVYDAFFEMLPDRLNRLTDALRGYDYAIDLYATKAPRHLNAEYVLTTRPCRQARLAFGRSLWPMELNVVEAVPGREICLCKKTDLRWGGWADLLARKRSHDYFTRRRRMSRRLRLQFALVDLVEWLRGAK